MKGKTVDNNDHDFAVEVSDGEEQKSDENDEEDEEDDGTGDLTKTQNQKYQQWRSDNQQVAAPQ